MTMNEPSSTTPKATASGSAHLSCRKDAMKSLLEFDDAGAQDDHPARGVTVGDIRAWHDEIERLRLALSEIAKGEGRFSTDHLTHASNTIEDMKEIAVLALTQHNGGDAQP